MSRPARRGISRFIVMAMLQAERARRLGLSDEAADSFGLNRAIFYAVAKAAFRSSRPDATFDPSKESRAEATAVPVGDGVAYRDPDAANLLFAIGGETQTPDAYRRQVADRFGDAATFARARAEVEEIVRAAPEVAIRSAREFFDTVYRPRRDELALRWSDWVGLPPAGAAARARRRAPPP
jgi:hypothetical protein